MKRAISLRILLTFCLLSQTATLCFAQDSIASLYYVDNPKHWHAEIPLWIPGFRGQFAYGDFELSTSGDREEREFSRFNNETGLEFYFSGKLAARYNQLWIQADAFSGAIRRAISYTPMITGTETEIIGITIQGTIPRLIAGYSVWQKSNENSFQIELLPYLGVRYISFHLQTDIFNAVNIIDVRPHWFEPIIGLYVPIAYKRYKVEFQGDYGVTTSEKSWVVGNLFRYQASDLIEVQLGWNLIGIEHKGTLLDQDYKMRFTLIGPTAGVGFRF